jgi:hypothetical protein
MLEQTNPPTQNAQQFGSFMTNVDSWIKDFNHQMNDISVMAEAVDENISNTNHNYEMLQKMKKQIDSIQQEVKTMKLMQLLVLKKAVIEKKI